MSLAIIYSRAVSGVDAPLVTVEVHLSKGMPGFNIVGLPEAAVKESRDRVKSALFNNGFEFPVRHITVNLAPADLPKEGGRFDLPIAVGILAASDQLPKEALSKYEFTGELALSGELRSVRGVLPMAVAAHKAGRQLILPAPNATEAALFQPSQMLHATHFTDVCAHLRGQTPLPPCIYDFATLAAHQHSHDMADVKGQMFAKRALEIAAAGRHSLLFFGPPGSGKTMLASRLPSILPEMSDEAALEVASLASISTSGFNVNQWKRMPFRSPHHSCSSVALVGGGRPPRPGEISLAHQGVLFLDELPEFSRHVLECLREPLESGQITISRAAFQVSFPAQFQFIAAMNPCPCGYAGSPTDNCHCTPDQIKRYTGKISGPMMDRIDMQVEVARISSAVLSGLDMQPGETSAVLRERVIKSRQQQLDRQGKFNAFMTVPDIDKHCEISENTKLFLNRIMEKYNLSGRVYHRILKVARTISDLALEQTVSEQSISEALLFRGLDRSAQHFT